MFINRVEIESGISNEDSQLVRDIKDSIHYTDNKRTINPDPKDETMFTIDRKTMKLADTIVKKNTMENRIYPNRSIMNNLNKSPQAAKYGITMYNPSINHDTLKKFFSVKLVKSNKYLILKLERRRFSLNIVRIQVTKKRNIRNL